MCGQVVEKAFPPQPKNLFVKSQVLQIDQTVVEKSFK